MYTNILVYSLLIISILSIFLVVSVDNKIEKVTVIGRNICLLLKLFSCLNALFCVVYLIYIVKFTSNNIIYQNNYLNILIKNYCIIRVFIQLTRYIEFKIIKDKNNSFVACFEEYKKDYWETIDGEKYSIIHKNGKLYSYLKPNLNYIKGEIGNKVLCELNNLEKIKLGESNLICVNAKIVNTPKFRLYS